MITFKRLGSYGRLGNQLFQIASTIGIAERNDCAFAFPRWKYSDFFSNRLPLSPPGKYIRFTEKSYSYEDVVLDKGADWDLHGYFQSWRYFSYSEETVKHYFTFDPRLCSSITKAYENILDRETVSVHIRRGDYLTLPEFHPVVEAEWYNIALQQFDPGICKIVFSDDIDWCMNNLRWSNMFFARGNECEDLFLMSCCTHNILANSSFSWWGAWLNQNPGKRVVAPKTWFGPALKHDISDLHVPSWILL